MRSVRFTPLARTVTLDFHAKFSGLVNEVLEVVIVELSPKHGIAMHFPRPSVQLNTE